MDGRAAIEHNHEALRRILATLLAMAGFVGGPESASDASGCAPILPRRLRLAVLRLLRPAEAAARRLIMALAMTMPPQAGEARASRPVSCKPRPKSAWIRNGVGTGIVLPRGFRPPGWKPAAPARRPGFPLLDPLRRTYRRPRGARSFPRICTPGFSDFRPLPVAKPRSPDDPAATIRLRLRLDALGRALEDLPRQARRFRRWRARSAVLRDRRRPRRVWPLRPGRPPGCRLPGYDPSAPRRPGIREIDEILAHAHALATFALERRDSS